MNYFKTAMLLAGLTALFMGVGYLIGGASGAMIAFVVAAATNLFTYWNSDRMVLSIYGAHEVDRNSAPELFDLVAELASRAGLHHGVAGQRHPAQIVRHKEVVDVRRQSLNAVPMVRLCGFPVTTHRGHRRGICRSGQLADT